MRNEQATQLLDTLRRNKERAATLGSFLKEQIGVIKISAKETVNISVSNNSDNHFFGNKFRLDTKV